MSREGSHRAKDMRPLQWCFSFESARLKAAEVWRAKFNQMNSAINKRTVPREPLEEMPRPKRVDALQYQIPLHLQSRECFDIDPSANQLMKEGSQNTVGDENAGGLQPKGRSGREAPLTRIDPKLRPEDIVSAVDNIAVLDSIGKFLYYN